MAGGYTKAVLNKLNKTGMVQLYMKTESNMGANITTLTNDIKDVMDYFKSLEEEIAIVKNQTINWFIIWEKMKERTGQVLITSSMNV